MAGQAHHRGRRYVTESARIRALANANPNAVCWRCGLTLTAHPPHVNGKPQRWTAGHTVDGSRTWQPWRWVDVQPPPGDWLAPEGSRCNVAAENDRRLHRTEPRPAW
jgi:hypothetical protein